jgi:hypothetical protein
MGERWRGRIGGKSEEACSYAELAEGAEFLAAISENGPDRIEHLKMAGLYHVRALEAGGAAGAEVLN